MYKEIPITGSGLPPKTLCLTYDDGPGETPGIGRGPHTLKLAEYLSREGIRATFFMVGKDVERFPELLPQIKALGHLIGNHTYNHPNLIDHLNAGGNLVDQIARTDALLKPWVDSPFTFVRPPYGSWSAEIAQALNSNLAVSLAHIGPINWDIDGSDWSFWLNGSGPEACADAYLDAITAAGRGIVLMHDSTADIATLREGNLTCAMTEILIPALRDLGYAFVGLDQVPEIQAVAEARLQCALLASNGKYVSPQDGGGGEIFVDGPAIGGWEPIGVDYLAPGKVALTATNGLYLSPQDGGGSEVLANAAAVGEWEPLDLIPVGDDRVAFRTITGDFLTRETDAGGKLLANVKSIGEREVFSFRNLGPS